MAETKVRECGLWLRPSLWHTAPCKWHMRRNMSTENLLLSFSFEGTEGRVGVKVTSAETENDSLYRYGRRWPIFATARGRRHSPIDVWRQESAATIDDSLLQSRRHRRWHSDSVVASVDQHLSASPEIGLAMSSGRLPPSTSAETTCLVAVVGESEKNNTNKHRQRW